MDAASACGSTLLAGTMAGCYEGRFDPSTAPRCAECGAEADDHARGWRAMHGLAPPPPDRPLATDRGRTRDLGNRPLK